MLKIKRDRFREHFQAQFLDDFKWERLKYPVYFRKRHLITRHVIAYGLTFAAFLCAPFSHHAFILGLTLATTIAGFYFLARNSARRLRIRRIAPGQGHENKEVRVIYEIENFSPFPIYNISFKDFFSGSKNQAQLWTIKELQPEVKTRTEKQYTCDSGMGVHTFSDFTAVVSDPFGFFDFHVIEDKKDEIFIYPELINLPSLPIEGSKDSLQYGSFDVQQRGSSVNFMGIREYVQGDPLKQISWKLSLKHRRLMVKEFEKIVNAEITILVDMDSRFHAGQGAESTWEFMRDTTLSVATQQLGLGNSVQVLSQEGYIPMGRGNDHAHFISLCMPRFSPSDNKKDLVKLYWNMIPRGSTILYIAPWFNPKHSSTLPSLPLLTDKNSQCLCVFFDGTSFVRKKLFTLFPNLTDPEYRNLKAVQTETIKALARSGISAVRIEKSQDVGRTLVQWGRR